MAPLCTLIPTVKDERTEALIETYLQNKFREWLKTPRERMMEVRNGRKEG